MMKRSFLLVTIVAAVASLSCQDKGESSRIHPLILFGVDGADWRVIDWMWDEGRLPNLQRLADRGIAASLETFHHASPVIWTTVATGVMPEVHGITEFVVPTGTGDQPVASTLRRVPALWNMLTAAGKRVAVIGWWASWPVEEINGVMISDRVAHDIPDRVWPPDRLDTFESRLASLRAEEKSAAPPSIYQGDRIIARTAVALANEDFVLTLLYLRGVDISCHFHWCAFSPERFPDLDPRQREQERELIAREYELVDRTLGDLLAAIRSEVNIIIMSDHGFDAMERETTHIRLNFDTVLERLGFLTMSENGVDFSRTELYSYASPERSLVKKVRFALVDREEGGRVTAAQRSTIRDRLKAALQTVTYRGGGPVFVVRDATRREAKRGADFSIEVIADGARKPLEVAGVPLPGAIRSINRLTGTHGRKTPGIFIAAGPDIDPRAKPDRLRVIDVPPTVLYAIGLPIAEDFAGRARIDIFTKAFRSGHDLQTIPSWGKAKDGQSRASDVDDELLEQLRALGYIE